MNGRNLSWSIILTQFIIAVGGLISWIINLIKLINSDFLTPAWGQIIVHGVGVIVFPASLITVWFK